MIDRQYSQGLFVQLLMAVALALFIGAMPCHAQQRTSDKPTVQRVTETNVLDRHRQSLHKAFQQYASARTSSEKQSLRVVERELGKHVDRLNDAFNRQPQAGTFLKDYQSLVAALEKARSLKERQQASDTIARHFVKHRSLAKETLIAAQTDLSEIADFASGPMASFHDKLVPKVTENGAIVWVPNDQRGDRTGGQTGSGRNRVPDEKPQAWDLTLTGNYSQAWQSYVPDQEHPGGNTIYNAAEGKIVSDIHAWQGSNPLGDSIWDYVFLGEVISVPAGFSTLRVSADLTYSREWNIQAIGFAQAGGWLELSLVELPQGSANVTIGNSSADEEASHPLGNRWVLAGQDDIPPPDQPPSPVEVTLNVAKTIPNADRSYLVYAGGIFRADAQGLAANAHVKTNIKINKIRIQAEQ